MDALPDKTTGEESSHSKWIWILLALTLLFFGGIRYRLLDVPLERDEGEYAYAGQLILQGVPPYKLAYNMKLPGTYAAYAATMAVFGETIQGIHFGLLVVNAATSLLVFLLARKWLDGKSSLAASASYALLSTSSSVLGLAAHATHFVVFFALAGVLVLLKAQEKERTIYFFLGGFLLGVGFIMKQPGIFFCMFGMFWMAISEWRKQPKNKHRLFFRMLLLALGMIIPFGVTCMILWTSGVFKTFWFWTFSYARAYASEISLSQGSTVLLSMLPKVWENNLALWALGGIGLAILLFKKQPLTTWIAGFLSFSILAVCPGFFFRPHYFILMLPALALLVGVAVHESFARWNQGPATRFKHLPGMVFVAAFVFSIFAQWEHFFGARALDISVMNYGSNPFIESIEISRYIQKHTQRDAKVAVIGSEPQIYFYAHRRAATGYIYTYALMEEHPYARQMQKEMIEEIEKNRPEFLVLVMYDSSWLGRTNSDQSLFHWFNSYRTNFTLVGRSDFVSPGERNLRWESSAASGPPAKQYVEILQRRFEQSERGSELARNGDFTAAIGEFSQVLSLDPENFLAHYNLGLSHERLGQWEKAASHFAEATLIDMYDANSRFHLGLAYLKLNQFENAVTSFKIATALPAASPALLNNLAWIMATHPRSEIRNGSIAVLLAEEICKGQGKLNPNYLDTLAAAYAEAGRFEDATRIGKQAMDLFSGPEKEALEGRLKLYEQRLPYHEEFK